MFLMYEAHSHAVETLVYIVLYTWLPGVFAKQDRSLLPLAIAQQSWLQVAETEFGLV